MIFIRRYLEQGKLKPIKTHVKTYKFFIEFRALFMVLESRNRKSFYGKVITHQ
jgi:hypothetical protein